ncbi:MAG TPA: zinc-binding dehydrogenase [Candidatus Bathyarchaeia archaeon]|nr:zinc-binding dehydrogenase [Candidatus Bathyarchaeia archaeon]
MAKMVKAAVMTKPGSIVIENFEKPEVDSDSILLKTEVAGICGTDVHIFQGHLPTVPFPIIPAHEYVGKVETLGASAVGMEARGQNLIVGDRVAVVPCIPCGRCFYCKNVPSRPNLCENRICYGITMSSKNPPHLLGGMAENMYVVPRSSIYRIPDDMPSDLAVLTEPLAVATKGLERAYEPGVPYAREGFGIGKSVVVQGIGPIGLFAVVAARAAGAGMIIAIDSVDLRLRAAEEFGANVTINMKNAPKKEDRVAEVKRLTLGKGADVVLECAGVPAAFAEGLELVRRGGKLVELGHYTNVGTVEVNPRDICWRDVDILGSWSYPPTQFETALNLLYYQRDRFPFKKMITHRFSIEDAAKGIEKMNAKDESIKVVITP